MSESNASRSTGAPLRFHAAWRRWRRRILALAVAAYFAGGFYFVEPDQRAVVRFGGRLTAAEVPPGPHYAWPWPLGNVVRLQTTQIRRVIVGFDAEARERISRGDVDAMTASPRTDMLSGDTNILKVSLVVQYQVTDPAAFVLRCVAPDELVRVVAQAVLVETLARRPVDELLTGARVDLRDRGREQMQRRLDHYGCGIGLVSVSVQSVEPPQAVIAAFNDVTDARYYHARLVQRAGNEADVAIRAARAQAFERVQAARDYAAQVLARARGEASSFLQQLASYRLAPDVTRQRLLLETLDRVLPSVRTWVLDDGNGRYPVDLRFVEPTLPDGPTRADPPPAPPGDAR